MDDKLELAKTALFHAESWINSVPHGDNCFLMNDGEYNQCYCGRDSVLDVINEALMANWPEALLTEEEMAPPCNTELLRIDD